ncbi:unnamed protein product [Ascophyllum nodosum]
MCSFLCCGQCCGLLSLFGVFFLFSVSNMFHTQPMYTDVEVWHDHEDEEAGNNCFLAAWIYVVTFALSIGCWYYGKNAPKKKRPAIADSGVSVTDEALGVRPVTLAI